eukprot:TRINITY_DN694_c0_g1_i1.p1 TRINITY_DN694_c0_g1~~TRINITY_DN694_c0_g1_i1.p1  ORF type:complete len:868 (+),score=191.84 TRINITY_DN694_c0_g1_i1:77-2605(+)
MESRPHDGEIFQSVDSSVYPVATNQESIFDAIRQRVLTKGAKQEERKQHFTVSVRKLQQSELARCSYISHEDGPLGPACVAFYKHLAKRPEGSRQDQKSTSGHLKLLMPDTILYGDPEGAMWFYTSKEGYIYRTDTFAERHVVRKIGEKDETIVAAVLKRPHWEHSASMNEITLLDTRELRMLAAAPPPGLHAVQKFVRCRGPRAWIARAVHGATNKQCFAWFITNKTNFDDGTADARHRYTTATDTPGDVTVFRSSGSATKDLLDLNKHFVEYLEHACRAKFAEFVADYLRDEKDRWWLLQVKAYRIKEQAPPSPLKGQPSGELIRLRQCRCCGAGFPPNEIAFTLTQRMIRDTVTHLRGRGVMMRWFNRAEAQARDAATGSQAMPVCRGCYDLYVAERQLVSLEAAFAQAIGIPPAKKILQQHRTSDRMPRDWHLELPDEPKLVVRDGAAAVPARMTQYRIMIVLYELTDVPKLKDSPSSFSLEFTLLESPTTVNVLLASPSTLIRKMRVFHFFALEDAVVPFLQAQGCIRIELKTSARDGATISVADLPLEQFTSGAVDCIEFCQLFTGAEMAACSLRAAIGIEKGRMVTIDEISTTVRKHMGVWIPNHYYSTCDPLPDEWFAAIPTRTVPQHRSPIMFQTPTTLINVRQHSNLSSSMEHLLEDDEEPLPGPVGTRMWSIILQVHSAHNLDDAPANEQLHVEYALFDRRSRTMAVAVQTGQPAVFDAEEKYILRSPLQELHDCVASLPALELRLFSTKRGLVGVAQVPMRDLADAWAVEGAWEVQSSDVHTDCWLSVSLYLGPQESSLGGPARVERKLSHDVQLLTTVRSVPFINLDNL